VCVHKLLIVGFLLLVLVPAGTAAPARTARVAVTDTAPFTVHGTKFLAKERVSVTVSVNQAWTHRVTAGSTGGFTTQFPRLSLNRCAAYVVRASGSRGSVAVLKVIPACAPDSPPAELYPLDPPVKGK
jgi:hypothetical protein